MAGEPSFKGTAEEWFTQNGMARHEVARMGPYVLVRRDNIYGRSIEDSRVTTRRGRIVGTLIPADFGPGWATYRPGSLTKSVFPNELAAFKAWVEGREG